MTLRLNGLSALVLGAACFAFAPYVSVIAQDKDKNTIKSLFDGVPDDLRSNVASNPVRCDRVNDWLEEHVNGKGKVIEVSLRVANVITDRTKDKTYRVFMDVSPTNLHVLDDDWQIRYAHKPGDFGGAYNFSFEGVSTAEAEKLIDVKHFTLKGKVNAAFLSRNNNRQFGGEHSTIRVFLEDVEVDGKKWNPYVAEVKKGGGAGPGLSKKGKKGTTQP